MLNGEPFLASVACHPLFFLSTLDLSGENSEVTHYSLMPVSIQLEEGQLEEGMVDLLPQDSSIAQQVGTLLLAWPGLFLPLIFKGMRINFVSSRGLDVKT